MSETKHTPGPWKAEEIGGQIHIGSEPVSDDYVFGYQIADMVQSQARGTKDAKRVEADAYLIVASPDLLEVARIEHALHVRGFTLATARSLSHEAEYAYRSAGASGLNNWRRQKREAAIAKAEGR